MAKFKVVKKIEGVVRINKMGMTSLEFRNKEQIFDAKALGPYKDELNVFQKRGVIEILPYEEKKGAPKPEPKVEKPKAEEKKKASKPKAEEKKEEVKKETEKKEKGAKK